jgi:RNA polymerase sigma-70 factor (ECF subfamily)
LPTNDIIAELYVAHGPRLYRYAVMLLADRTAAEDALQDTFVQLARALRRRPDAEVSFGYLATTLRNTCYSALRRSRRRRWMGQVGQTGRVESNEALIEPVSPDASEEERMLIDDALRRLPAEQREVIYLKVYEGMTFQEIADRCAISINTAASRYRYATEALRRVLAPSDETC